MILEVVGMVEIDGWIDEEEEDAVNSWKMFEIFEDVDVGWEYEDVDKVLGDGVSYVEV